MAGSADSGDASDSLLEVTRDDTVWRFEREFLTSNWTCLFGNGCKGILAEEAEVLNQGCCSLGAHFGDGPAGQAEARQLSAYVSMLTPEQWQFHDVGTVDHTPPGADDGAAAINADTTGAHASDPTGAGDADLAGAPGSTADAVASESVGTVIDDGPVAGWFGDLGRTHTRVVEGACVFLNRPGFAGGDGCALHIAAVEAGDSPTEWKPSVCWQLPLRVDWALLDDADPDGPETATVRRWSRADWGEHGTTMAWCCTERSEGGEAYSGDSAVIDSLADELRTLAGDEVYVELRSRLDP